MFLGQGPDSGTYTMPNITGSQNTLFKKSHHKIGKSERGLLPDNYEQSVQKSNIYNNSHAQVSPNSYNQSTEVYQKSIYRNNNKIAK